MKKIHTSILLILVVSLLNSCAKTTKGKVSKDWVVTNYSVKTTLKDGNTSQLATTGEQNSGETTITADNGMQPQNIPIIIYKNAISLNKNGEWEQDIKYKYAYIDSSYGQSNEVSTITITYDFVSKGTWSFMSKNTSQDLKKNEIIHFYSTDLTGTENQIVTNSSGTTSSSSNMKSTYKGDVADMGILLPVGTVQLQYGISNTWKVKSSTRKELVLEQENKIDKNTSPSMSSLIQDTKLSITLSKK